MSFSKPEKPSLGNQYKTGGQPARKSSVGPKPTDVASVGNFKGTGRKGVPTAIAKKGSKSSLPATADPDMGKVRAGYKK